MKTTTIRLPDGLHNALLARGKNLNAVICSLLAESLGVDYTPSKRGGRRIPKALTAEQIAQIEIIPTPTMPAVLEVKKKTFVRTVVSPTAGTLAALGYPCAEIFKANNRFTSKLFKAMPEYSRTGCRYEDVGSMTLAEFEKVCGRPATFED